jgi:hypothetical protein
MLICGGKVIRFFEKSNVFIRRGAVFVVIVLLMSGGLFVFNEKRYLCVLKNECGAVAVVVCAVVKCE